MPVNNECDASVMVGVLVVFSLPLLLRIPGFPLWDVIPKEYVTRFHPLSQEVTWFQLIATLIVLLFTFFTLYLETRKRMLDDMVEKVLTVSQATDTTVGVERERQTSAVKASIDLLDAATDQYERLMLLKAELRRRDKIRRQQPPVIELSSTEI